jgi:VAD1 Analog of StAR-related lipid transfer domain
MALLSSTRSRDQLQVQPAFKDDAKSSLTKLTVSTAHSTLQHNKQATTEFDNNKAMPTSASTISSAASLDMSKHQQHDYEVEDYHGAGVLVNNPSDPAAIPNSCSSPYQAFLFTSDWLGSRERELSRSNSQDKDETDSVVSGGYFEPVDLDSSNWTTAIRMNGPTFGFALVALATALVHPVLFVGVLTAFGTYQAVGAGYEYCNGDSAKAASWEQCLQSICHKEVAADEEPPLKALNFPVEEEEATPMDMIPLTAASLAAAAATAANDIIASEQEARHTSLKTNITAGATTTVPENEDKKEGSPDKLVRESSNKKSKVELVELAFPNLNTTVVQNVSFPGLHAIEFFRVFFANDAPYNFMELQKERGDLDIVYGEWTDLGPEDPTLLHDSSKGNDSSSEALATLVACSEVQGRVLTFKAKTNNFIGPVYATTRKTQRVLLCHKTCIVMESRTDLTDIPFCSTFYVVERWIIRAQKVADETGNGKSKYVSMLSATSEVVFTQSCQFASQIKSKSASTIKELTSCWCTMATEALKLTEQRKTLRLNQHARRGGESEIDDFDETELDEESNKTPSNKEQPEGSKENVPPSDDEEGIELCLTDDKHSDVPRLRHLGSGPLVSASKKHKLQKFRRSVSNLWTKRQ